MAFVVCISTGACSGAFLCTELVVVIGELDTSLVGRSTGSRAQTRRAKGHANVEFDTLAIAVVTNIAFGTDITFATVGIIATSQPAELTARTGFLRTLLRQTVALFFVALPGCPYTGATCTTQRGFGYAKMDVAKVIAKL